MLLRGAGAQGRARTAGGQLLAWSSGSRLGSPEPRPPQSGPSASLTHFLSFLWAAGPEEPLLRPPGPVPGGALTARRVPITSASEPEKSEWAPADMRHLLTGTQGPGPGARGFCTCAWLICRDWRGSEAAKCQGLLTALPLSKLREPVSAEPRELSCWASGGCRRARALLQRQEH